MRELLIALLAGMLFGAGLLISGMADPQRVLAFLTLGPDWDPSLALVMAGALTITVPGFALMRRRERPLFTERFTAPTQNRIDRRLLIGAALFGLGWGWAGYCPGPAIVGAGLGHWSALVFAAAMLAGGWLTARRVR